VRRTALAFALLAFGCFAPGAAKRGTPLYTVANAPFQPNQVARLNALLPGGAAPGLGATSFITSVDGLEVSAVDSAFELLPGCHVVRTADSLVVAAGNTTLTAQLGSRVFAFQMKGGDEYTVVVQLADPSASISRVSVFGIERDPSGAQTQELQSATSADDVKACLARTPP